MSRGRGITLMRLKGAELRDVATFAAESGLTWRANGAEKRLTDLTGYRGRRAGSGRVAPRGFPKDNRFG
jgi:topoisomerase-4 subunit A